MQRMDDLDVLVRHVLPQVLPCPKSMVLDALQAITVDFCRQSEVWSEQIQELGVSGDSAISLALPSGIEVVRVRTTWIDGIEQDGWRSEGQTVLLGFTLARDCTVTAEAILRPSRFSQKVPHDIIEEWGDILAYGALAKIKAMSGKGIEWSDPQGAGVALQLYNEGTARAKGRVIRSRIGSGELFARG